MLCPQPFEIIITLYFSKTHCSENGLLKLIKHQIQERPCASTKWVFNILNPFKTLEVIIPFGNLLQVKCVLLVKTNFSKDLLISKGYFGKKKIQGCK